MRLLIGIDSGGTSCRLVLCNETGTVFSQLTVPGHNPNADGFDALEESFRSGLDKLLCEHGGRQAAVAALHAGIAGGEGENKPHLIAMLQRLLPNCGSVRVSSDAVIALSSGLGRKDGGVLIAGTGTVGFLRKDGRLLRFGGWGYLADKGGSGWHLGRDGFRAAMAEEDSGLPETALTALYEEYLGMKMMPAIPALYRGEIHLAECARLVFRAAENGDREALRILQSNAACLWETLAAMKRVFEAPLPVVLVGGLLKEGSLYLKELQKLCEGSGVTLFHPALPPLYGAAYLAAEDAGLPEDPSFEAAFAASFRA